MLLISDYFVVEVEKLLEEPNLNEQFGWLYKDEKHEIETDDVLDNAICRSRIKVRSSCEIKP